MKTNRKVVAVFTIAGTVVAGLMFIERSPRNGASVVEPAFGYRQKEEAKIVERNSASVKDGGSQTPLAPRFNGYLTIGPDKWFALALPASDRKPEIQSWLKLGQKIGEFEVARFDTKKEMLILKYSDGQNLEVRLVDSKVIDSEAHLQQVLRQLIDTSPRSIRDIPELTAERKPKY